MWQPFLDLVSARKMIIYADFMDPFCYIGFHNAKIAAQK